jgi:hypothetical protein
MNATRYLGHFLAVTFGANWDDACKLFYQTI